MTKTFLFFFHSVSHSQSQSISMQVMDKGSPVEQREPDLFLLKEITTKANLQIVFLNKKFQNFRKI